LHPAEVKAVDLRAGAAMVIAALATKGVSNVNQIYHIERGYSHFAEKLQALGAKITRFE
jgi:UDP-N-acetylglucosamine 1-carboxyvinyltransferase